MRLDGDHADELAKYSVGDRQMIWKKQVVGLRSLCVDRKGTIYAALYADDIIQVFDSKGSVLDTIPHVRDRDQLYQPEAVCVDAENRLYVLHHVRVSGDAMVVVSVWRTDGTYLRRLVTYTHKSADWVMKLNGNILMISNIKEIRKYDLSI
jgi:hypothetical protein